MIIKIHKKINIKEFGKEYGYDFQIFPEKSGEDVRDFHLFSISIIKDILEYKFKLNESGDFSYDLTFLEKEEIEDTLFVLQDLYSIILKEKLDLDNQLGDLLK